MGHDKYTVLYIKDSISYKLCQIFFGADGSYYVTSPYHPAHEPVLFIATVNYALQETRITAEEMLDVASAEDDARRIKLSHHPDGFVQFSGQGIVSGKDAEGRIRGIGIMSWPLTNPVRGPAFALAMRHVEQFAQAGRVSGEPCIFEHHELTPMPEANVLILEGYYFPPLWRRFVRTEPDGTRTISIFHPARAALRLKVLLPSGRSTLQGFIGLELYTDRDDSQDVTGTIILSGPTGNLRRNKRGQMLADGIYCMYPRSNVPIRRSIDYTMPEVPQHVHEGRSVGRWPWQVLLSRIARALGRA